MPIPVPAGEDATVPLAGFAFHVHFAPTASGTGPGSSFAPLDGVAPEVAGGFSEVTGLEATMEPRAVAVGGRNHGALQRPGPVTFATVVLKRGIIATDFMWSWWALFAGANGAANGGWSPAGRCDVSIALIRDRTPVIGWKLENAMPIKFRVGDLNARSADVLVEELHLAHEGLHSQGVA